jgi:MinD superfamily P-loop ATPase
MSYRVAVASGKGGTGKTTVAGNLFQTFIKKGADAVLADCDVEEPNAALFFDKSLRSKQPVEQPLPEIVTSQCTFCGRCVEACAFNAILMVKSIGHIKVMPELCHSCGACLHACPERGAIREYPKILGHIHSYELNGMRQTRIVEGELKIGQAMAVPVIKDVKRMARALKSEITIIDAPPGTSCPAMETVHDSDYVILVAEPTPFGISDLKIMLETVLKMNLAVGIILNRSDKGTEELKNYLKEKNVEVLMEIPFDKEIAEAYSEGNLLTEHIPWVQRKFNELYHSLIDKIQSNATNNHR